MLADVLGPTGTLATLPQIDRDYYRVGFGLGLVRLIQTIQNAVTGGAGGANTAPKPAPGGGLH
jgi:hypothetical protein